MKTSASIKSIVENLIFKSFIIIICTIITIMLTFNNGYNDEIEITSIDFKTDTYSMNNNNDLITNESDTLELDVEIIEDTYEPVIETIVESPVLIEPVSYKPDEMPNEYYSYVEHYSNIYNVDIPVLMAVLISENPDFNPIAENFNKNGTIDIGLCQVNSKYVDYYADVYDLYNFDPYNANQNIHFLACHVKYLLDYANEYGLNGEEALLFMAGAYNRGLGSEKENRNMYHYKEKFLNNYNALITNC